MLVSNSDQTGGAARAAYRLHLAFKDYGMASQMKVRNKVTDDASVLGPSGYFERTTGMLRHKLGWALMNLQQSANTHFHSTGGVPSNWSAQINASDADVVNLHWVAYETMSIGDIGRIQKPVVWTLHDMWPFCGTEHYTNEDESARWRTGYTRENRPDSHSGLDIDRYQWHLKQRAWQRAMHIVSPSHWLAECARKSALFNDWPISVIPNVMDTKTYKPLPSDFCRDALGLPQDKKILLFGAIGGGKDPRKGYDLLLKALKQLSEKMDSAGLLTVVFGQKEPSRASELALATHWMGHVHDDVTLALLYNAADVMIVPSRQEAFGQTASEALSCGCPVVAFDCTGLQDVVVHRKTGYLARAYEAESMADGIYWILNNPEKCRELGLAARERAIKLWSAAAVVPQYQKVYRQMLNR